MKGLGSHASTSSVEQPCTKMHTSSLKHLYNHRIPVVLSHIPSPRISSIFVKVPSRPRAVRDRDEAINKSLVCKYSGPYAKIPSFRRHFAYLPPHSIPPSRLPSASLLQILAWRADATCLTCSYGRVFLHQVPLFPHACPSWYASQILSRGVCHSHFWGCWPQE